MSDGITPEMIEARQAKIRLTASIEKLLDSRIEQSKEGEDVKAKARAMRDTYLAKATAQPDEFFRGKDVATVMRALQAI